MADIQVQKEIIEALKPLINKIIDEHTKNTKKIRPMQVYEQKTVNGQLTISLVDVGDYDFEKNEFINNTAKPIEIFCDSRYTYNKGDFVNIEWAYSMNNAKVSEYSEINLNQSFFFEVLDGNLILNFFEWEDMKLKFSLNENGELICDYGDLERPNLVVDSRDRLIYQY